MSTTITYIAFNITNIASKITQLETRVDSNLEINSLRSGSISFNPITNEISITFTSNPPDSERLVLNNLILIIVEENSVTDVYPAPRIFGTQKTPTATDDALNGYNIGCICVHTVTLQTYICGSNITDNAVWISRGDATTSNFAFSTMQGTSGAPYIFIETASTNYEPISNILFYPSVTTPVSFTFAYTTSTTDTWNVRLFRTSNNTSIFTLTGISSTTEALQTVTSFSNPFPTSPEIIRIEVQRNTALATDQFRLLGANILYTT